MAVIFIIYVPDYILYLDQKKIFVVLHLLSSNAKQTVDNLITMYLAQYMY